MKKTKKLIMSISLVLLVVMLVTTVGIPTASATDGLVSLGESPAINQLDGIDIDESDFFAPSAVTKVPQGLDPDEKVSLIVQMKGDTLLDAYNASKTPLTFGEYFNTSEAKAKMEQISKERLELISALEDAGISYSEGDEYTTVMRGFEITVRAKYYEEIQALLMGKARVILGDEYQLSETKYVENKVDVYETGIFDSSEFPYDGEGMVIAVLDTGLDYYHSAFNNFTVPEDKLGLTFDEVASLIGTTAAAGIQPGLTASDVYISSKVPFGFDYADYDSDVYPLRSHHGTHVSGIIAGFEEKDNFVGVAPNAQLVEMKIFSDIQDTARSSWILSALEDCVILGVDVINLSIGTSCGFSTESEKEALSGVYDAIRGEGISLIVAASNSFNSGYGSEKNGNLDLNSNPDSGTIGSPATYNGALAVASVEGEKKAYLLYNGAIVYFNESTSRGGDEKNFVKELLAASGKDSVDIEFIKVPGVGRKADYGTIKEEIKGKIALVSRGSNTFEEKVNTAQAMGAAGIIIYNNVSGDILMNVGTTTIPACSISQDDGEMLAKIGRGTIRIAKQQAAGPFISDFSSWGPSPDLELKPEVTAHGGSILSAVPGQDYDRISGTSMATPNVAGVVALLRQHIKTQNPGISSVDLTARINRLLMSTADILYNMNGLAYSPRKQGAGLTNLNNAAYTTAYILTYDRKDGSVMDKSKIELGDDPTRSGVYTLVFTVDNFGDKTLEFDVSTYVMTEGVSETKTSRGETTVTQDGYLLEGADIVTKLVSGGSLSGTRLTVSGGSKATVEITVTLSEENKKYLDESFENGMYVEGFVTLDNVEEGGIDLSVPYLAFYGDWTEAPIFDIDYYETNRDELDESLNDEDKTLPDAYATRPIGGLSGDYVGYLGSFYYDQKPGSDKISADRNHISLSNQEDAINSLRYIWTGMLRGAAMVEITITDDSTGEVVYYTTDEYVRKSYSDGGAMIYPANVDVDFSAIEHNLKNNTKYTVTMKGLLDYGDGGENTNKNNTFTFPLVTDFSAPNVTGCEFYYEYDRSAKKNRLYARVAIYDNHYAMSALVGYVGYDSTGTGVTFYNFDQYMTPIKSEYNSTSYLTYELTDYIDDIKSNAYNKNTFTIMCYDYALNNATYEIELPDEFRDAYYENTGADTVELVLGREYDITDIYTDLTPDLIKQIYSDNSIIEILDSEVPGAPKTSFRIKNQKRDGSSYRSGTVAMLRVTLKDGTKRELYASCLKNTYLEPSEISKAVILSPNQTFRLEPLVYPDTEWGELLEFEIPEKKVATVVGTEVLALAPGSATVNTYYYTSLGRERTQFYILVLTDKDDSGFKQYTKPVVKDFAITGYTTNKAFYFLNTEDRDIGATGDIRKFTSEPFLSMYPSESVTLSCDFTAYFPNVTEVKYESSDYSIAYVNKDGVIEALKEGGATVTAKIYQDGSPTYYTASVRIEVKNPYVTNGPQLVSYFGNGGIVSIPAELCLTHIGQFAFSNYHYIDKGPEDEISEEVPETTKIWYIGEDTITHIIIPEGVEEIGMYAFAGLTSLKKVTLPSTLKSISNGAFLGCESLTEIEGIKHVKFINQEAFAGCNIKGDLKLNSAIAISDYAFLGNKNITKLELSEHTRSIGAYAFAQNTGLKAVSVAADKIKLGQYAFSGCTSLTDISVNAAVLPTGIFEGCTSLKSFSIGKDVEVIGEYAFAGTSISAFTVENGNKTFTSPEGAGYLLSADGTEILLVSPSIKELKIPYNDKITKIAAGAFSGCKKISEVYLPNVTEVGDYAFSECRNLYNIKLGPLTKIGKFAFCNTKIYNMPEIKIADGTSEAFLTEIGSYAFYGTNITSVTIPGGITVGDYAFAECEHLASVTVQSGTEQSPTKLGAYAFSYSITYSNKKTVAYIDVGNTRYYYYVYSSPLTSIVIGDNVELGTGAFSGAASVVSVDLGDNVKIGDYAFYHADSLKSIDLSGATYIGDCAFTGGFDYYYKSNIDRVLSSPAINDVGTSYLFIYYTPDFKEVDLSSATYVGKEAFIYCGFSNDFDRVGQKLTTVILGDAITEIGEGAFASCTELDSINLDKIEKIGDYAFYNTGIKEADLTSAVSIGAQAFEYCEKLQKVTLGKNIELIGAEAFAYDELLEELEGLGGVEYIGDSAFAYTGITTADLANAVYVGSYAFIKQTLTDFTVALGEKITQMGENPFALCNITPISSETITDFGGDKYTEIIYDFDLNENIKIIDGCVYQVVPEGLVLITYLGNDKDVTVAEGTVRIAASAFRGSQTIKSVTLPHTLKSIGHKAFFGCTNLSLVTFKSFEAPVLEEEFDANYVLFGDSIPFKYSDGGVDYGLDIIKLGMYNILKEDGTPNYSNFFFGATFKDYVGRVTDKITMVAPSNGKNYDSFIFAQYFDLFIDGSVAADDTTLAAIEAISKLPESITLAHKSLVEAARMAYNKIATNDQKALVTEYQRLTKAESRIKDLEYAANKGDQAEPEVPDTPSSTPESPAPENGGDGISVGAFIPILAAVLIAGLACGFSINKYTSKKRKPTDEDGSSENSNDFGGGQ